FKTFSQFSRKCFKFLFVHNLPVSVVGVKISKTGNYTILFTVSLKKTLPFYPQMNLLFPIFHKVDIELHPL
ncbi:hypothetical protein BFI50_22455, partial [Yersinia pestis subsp. microtus bv. Xilingolensis]